MSFRDWWDDLVAAFQKWWDTLRGEHDDDALSVEVEDEPGQPAGIVGWTLPDVPIGDPGVQPAQVKIVDKQWRVKNQPRRLFGIAIDWAVQPDSFDSLRRVMDAHRAAGLNLAVAYAGPGICKPVGARCEGHAPYLDLFNLQRNPEYVSRVLRRADYLEANGWAIVWAYSFVDRGIFDARRFNQDALEADLMYWMKLATRYPSIAVPISEGHEGNSASDRRTDALVERVRRFTGLPATYHSTGESRLGDWIAIQTSNRIGTEKARAYADRDLPVIVMEHRDQSDEDVARALRACAAAGVTYTITSRNFGMSDRLATDVQQIIREYA